jgi:hypothetical protein
MDLMAARSAGKWSGTGLAFGWAPEPKVHKSKYKASGKDFFIGVVT